MKKIIAWMVAVMMIAALIPAAMAAEVSAEPAKFEVTVDGEAIDAVAYAIEGSTYLRLLDIAYALGISAGWNEEEFAAVLNTEEAFEGDAPEIPEIPEGAVEAEPAKFEVIVNGEKIEATAYAIGGNTYLKFVDIAKAVDVGVWWDAENFTARIETDKTYDPDYKGPEADAEDAEVAEEEVVEEEAEEATEEEAAEDAEDAEDTEAAEEEAAE